MSVLISGALINGAGIPMSGCRIILKARNNTSAVVMRTTAEVITGENGEYSFEAQTGKYQVYLRQRDGTGGEYRVGTITVCADSAPGTLNDFLLALGEEDLKPDVVKRFEELAAQAQQAAKDSASSATDSKNNADSAEQAKNDIDAALTGTVKVVNHLSEIAAEGAEAQQESRDNLGLKRAATMDVQADIYDRTADRLAIPGVLGFGALFSGGDRIEFKTKADFIEWAKKAKPGRYTVFADTNVVVPGIQTSGVIEIIWPEPQTNPNPAYARKIIIYYGSNGHIYYNRYWSAGDNALPDWENLKLKINDFLAALYSSTGSSGAPDVGGLVLAAYTGASDDETRIEFNRVRTCAGSRLRQVVFEAEFRQSGFGSTPKALVGGVSLPGTYVSLSGTSGMAIFSKAVITLFMRIV